MLDCHPEPSRTKLRALMEKREASTYTTERNGCRKLIRQAPWHRDGRHAGFVEIVLALPDVIPHFVRDGGPARATPLPAAATCPDISDGDIYEAMKEIPGYLDISPGDLREVYRHAYRHALERVRTHRGE